VSFSYTSAPRTYYRSAPDYDYSNDSSLEVDVQRALKRGGYYTGRIDGDIGPASRAAIRSYQYERGLEPTGRIDAGLLRSLGI
jgi:peptidoglycan hydrolase-like protein with peptidoglycan-binding domain